MACIVLYFKVVANYPGKLVTKCLHKLATLIKSIWHLVSPSYDSKVSIHKITYWYNNLLVHLYSLHAGDVFVNMASQHTIRSTLHLRSRCLQFFCAVYHNVHYH